MNVEEEIMKLRERCAALERQVNELQQGPRVVPWPYIPSDPRPIEPYYREWVVTCNDNGTSTTVRKGTG